MLFFELAVDNLYLYRTGGFALTVGGVVTPEQSGSGESHVVGYLTYILVVVACHVADAYGQKRHFVPVGCSLSHRHLIHFSN